MPPFSASEGSRARPSLGTAPIETEAIPWQRAEISTSLPDLDLLIDRVCGHRATERAGSVSGDEPEQPTDQVAHGVGGLPSGSTLEIVGPPASGKTFLCISIAVKERLDALLRKNLDSSNDPLNRIRDGECRRNLSNLDRLRALSFDCHWERSCTDVEQVLIFDTEGSLSPERVVSFAESAIDSLLADQRFQRPSGFDQDGLFRAVLSGIHISRITSPHELIAALSCCLPPPNNEDAMSCRRGAYEDDLDCYKEANNGPDDYEYAKAFLPGRTSIIIIDTLSYLFRAPSTSARERSLRNASLEKIRSMEDSAGADGRGQAGVTCSIMGMETWRIILFRAGGLGHRFAQLFSPGCSSIDDVPAPRKDPSSQRWIPFDVS
ncbi:hypothetical protein IE53DRAFT_362168 [Violaceomyces palustris]|uniref:Uncharacterized protein n=1 Tax=Violaceomyces palustris TaxID=1673888 RepID=A0ACD0NXZ2_9BASI|nr:hypothetical protein IE53DRAFT_362168 [Violaceomyces palustris]